MIGVSHYGLSRDKYSKEDRVTHPPQKPDTATPPGNTGKALHTKDPAAQALGRKGGLRRAETISAERRSEIASLAARHRWSKVGKA